MPQQTIVKLFGVHALAHRPISWRLTSGVHPYTTVLEVDAASAKQLLAAAGRPSRMTITSDDDSLTVNEVYVLHEAPASAPYLGAVVLADRRWLWGYNHVRMDFNIRRRTGNRRLLVDGSIPQEVPITVDDVSYAIWSIPSKGKKWEAPDAIERVLKLVDPTARIQTDISSLRSVPIENMEIDDNGPAAVSRVLQHAPGAEVAVLLDGSVVVYDATRVDQARAAERRTGPAAVGAPLPAVRHFGAQRPAKVRVFFTPEQELRFDSKAEGDRYVSQKGVLEMENVVPVPDVTLNVAGLGTVCRGTWITMDQAIAAWNATGALAAGVTLSHDLIQELWLYGLDRMLTELGGPAAATSDWGARVSAIRTHYRQTYRLAQYWMARIKSLRAMRVSIIDPENGSRAPATAYSDHAIIAGERSRFTDLGSQGWVLNRSGYSALLANAKAAPAVVSVLDDEQGIVRIDYQLDPLHLWRAVVPGRVDNAPNLHWGMKGEKPISFDSTDSSGKAPRLAASHRVAIVLTAVPAAPNDIGQLHEVTVNPSDVAGLIGSDKVANPSGPVAMVRVGPGTATARFAWRDGDETAIRESFGVNRDGSLAPPKRSVSLEKLLVDSDEVKKVAEASAAVVYASMADRMVGGKSVRLDRQVSITGNLTEVEHAVGTGGEALTTLSFQDALPALSMLGFVSDSVRRQLFRLVQP